MQIRKGHRVTLLCSSFLEDGTSLDESANEPFVVRAGIKANTDVGTAVADALVGMKPNEVKHLKVPPRLAYGDVDPERVVKMRIEPGRTLVVGDVLNVKLGEGDDFEIAEGTVLNIEGEYANLDTNHPLAGQCLFMKIKVISFQ